MKIHPKVVKHISSALTSWSLFFIFILTVAATPQEVVVAADGNNVKNMALNVLDYGAKGNGETDDTEALQTALDAAAKAGGGMVRLPAGRYLTLGSLSVPSGVTLAGIWQAPHHSDQAWGTVLLAKGGRGQADGTPLIQLSPGSAVKGITIFYPDQHIDDVTPFPWTIRGRGMNCSVMDVTLVNAYQGIDFATYAHELHYIRNVFGCVLRRGIFVDKCTDIGRIENVHFNPHFWARCIESEIREGKDRWQKLLDYLNSNCEAFIFARSDWEYVTNTFCYGFKIGYKFMESKNGACNGNFSGIGADGGQYALWVEKTQQPGLLITNGEFVTFAGETPTELVTTPGAKGVVQLSNCSFWGPAHRNVLLQGNVFVSMSQCNFLDWGRKGQEAYSIRADAGELIVSNCRFAKNKPHIFLGAELQSAVIMGNRFAGKMQITNKSTGDVKMSLNVSPKTQ